MLDAGRNSFMNARKKASQHQPNQPGAARPAATYHTSNCYCNRFPTSVVLSYWQAQTAQSCVEDSSDASTTAMIALVMLQFFLVILNRFLM